ncbi:MAG: metallophosphoesterase family protein [Alphaproteobacteria bacterium]
MLPFRRRRDPKAAVRPSIPAGSAVYAVGDVHGRADLLADLQAQIVADARRVEADRRVVVYLGDYVDRGGQSREVIDRLLDVPLPGFESVHLMGNHEAFLLQFLETIAAGPGWMMNGGRATLASYGIQPPARITDAQLLAETQAHLRAALPEDHRLFLETLGLSHVEGDYAFVHAGIRPGVPLDEQAPADLLWIREPFLDWTGPLERVIVHGHTISEQPEIRPNRIGIDTGAFASGVLTCLALHGDRRWILRT